MDELTTVKMIMQLQHHVLEASKIIAQHEVSIRQLQAAYLELYHRTQVPSDTENLKH